MRHFAQREMPWPQSGQANEAADVPEMLIPHDTQLRARWVDSLMPVSGRSGCLTVVNHGRSPQQRAAGVARLRPPQQPQQPAASSRAAGTSTVGSNSSSIDSASNASQSMADIAAVGSRPGH